MVCVTDAVLALPLIPIVEALFELVILFAVALLPIVFPFTVKVPVEP